MRTCWRRPVIKPVEEDALRAAIGRLAGSASIEALPREVAEGGAGWSELALGTRVFVTRLPGAGFLETISAAQRLRERGFVPVPHLTARGTHSLASLEETLRRLGGEAGVDDILLIAGTQDPPAGDFHSTLDLLKTGIFERAGLRRIGIAGHPEGHPEIGETALDAALEAKAAFAQASGIALYLVTQFFFDAAPVIAWERRIRARGILFPVHAGLHGVTGLASLARHAARCGVGASAKMLVRPGRLMGLAATGALDRLLIDIARARIAEPESLFAGVHVFPLGGFAATAGWLAALRAGDYAIGADGARLTVRASR